MSKNGKKRVLFLSASVGAGHNQAARAIMAHLEKMTSKLHVSFIDVLDMTPKLFRLRYAGGYKFVFTRFPTFYGMGYQHTDRPQSPERSAAEYRRLKKEAHVCQHLLEQVRQEKPHLIVHTHFLAPPAMQHIINDNWRPAQFIVQTDIEAHRWWFCPAVDKIFLPQPESVSRLKTWGLPEKKLIVSGIPVHPKWTEPLPEHSALRKTWSLPPDKPIILISGGTEFTCGPIARLAAKLANKNPQACFVVLAGRNKKLLSRLAKLRAAKDRRVVPMGFTDRLHELAEIAEMMITKAGGLTTAECLAKSLPMVLLPPVPGQEAVNAEFFRQHGAACISHNFQNVIELTTNLLIHRHSISNMRNHAGELFRPGGKIIAQAIIDALA